MPLQIGVDPSADGRRVAVDRSLRGVRVAGADVRAGTVVAAVPATALTFRTFTFPFHDRRKLEGMVAQELEHGLAFPLSDAVWDFCTRTPTEDDPNNVFAVACPRSRLDAVLEAAGEPAPEVLDAEPFAFQRALVLARQHDGLVVDLGATHTTFCRVTAGHLDFVRVLLHGGNALSAQVAAARSLNGESARRLKEEQGMELAEARVFYQRLLDDALLPTTPSTVPLSLAGGGARTPGLGEWLRQKLGRPVQPLPMPEGTAPDRDAAALGMGLWGMRGGEGINLLSRAATKQPPLVTAGIWALLILSLVAVDLRFHEFALARQVGRYETAIQTVVKRAAPDLDARAFAVEKLESAVKLRQGAGSAGGTDVLPLLATISKAMAAASSPLHVHEIKLGEGDLSIQGEAASFNDVDTLQKGLGSLGRVADQSNRSLGTNKVSFRLRIALGGGGTP